jgi:hypothetical protein
MDREGSKWFAIPSLIIRSSFTENAMSRQPTGAGIPVFPPNADETGPS